MSKRVIYTKIIFLILVFILILNAVYALENIQILQLIPTTVQIDSYTCTPKIILFNPNDVNLSFNIAFTTQTIQKYPNQGSYVHWELTSDEELTIDAKEYLNVIGKCYLPTSKQLVLDAYIINDSIKITPYWCIESWKCTNWGSCINNQQIRVCTDSKSCGTNDNKPIEQQNCITGCIDGQTKSCGTSNMGVCKYGTQACNNNIWGDCTGNIEPKSEICGDNIDNSCDGAIDENCETSCVPEWECKIEPENCPASRKQNQICMDKKCKNQPTKEELTCTPTKISCNGCEYNEGCVFFGFRDQTKYCDINKVFTLQKEDENACNNNYECKSNMCSRNKCVNLQEEIRDSVGLLKKIYCKITNLFNANKYQDCIKEVNHSLELPNKELIEPSQEEINNGIRFTTPTKVETKLIIPNKKSVCGNGVIEQGEDCSICIEDVRCGTNEVCINTKCEKKNINDVPPEDVFELKTSVPDKVQPGRNFVVGVSLKNNLNANVRNVKVVVSSEFFNEERVINFFPFQNREEEFTFTISSLTKPGEYTANVRIIQTDILSDNAKSLFRVLEKTDVKEKLEVNSQFLKTTYTMIKKNEGNSPVQELFDLPLNESQQLFATYSIEPTSIDSLGVHWIFTIQPEAEYRIIITVNNP